MRAFRQSPIRCELMRIVLLAISVPLVVAFTALVAAYLQSGSREWTSRLWLDALMALVAILGSGGAVWLAYRRIQSLIWGPIAALVKITQAAQAEANLSIPASDLPTNELKAIEAGINQLRGQICSRGDQLRTLEGEMASRVAARTAELDARNSQLAREKTEAEQACRAHIEFLANMSHEIRTPMNAIMGMTELALHSDMDPTRREYLGLARSSAESLLTIINDILDVSKIEAGKLDIEKVEFSLRDCLGEVVKNLAVRAQEKGLELILRVHPEVPDNVLGDPGRLRQIVFNLVGNALKFTQQGEISVQVRVEASDEEGITLHFAVEDTGIGIPLEKRSVIFEAFAQADHSTSRCYGGTGLGLSISSRLVEMMGGKIWVDSQVGEGSIFHFTLKLAERNNTLATRSSATPATLQGVSVLVVDDNSTNRHMLNELLRHRGMKPALAENGQHGLKILEEASDAGKAFRLILLDYQMPDMDGFAFARHVRSDPRLNGAIIMMLTSGGQRGDAARCRDLCIAAYLVKPIRQRELMEAILTVLGQNPEPAGHQPLPVTCHSLREDRQHLCILLAEDNPVNQIVAVRLLEKMGHTVKVVGNGLDAVQLSSDEEFDLILMDVQMPEMDGLEATRTIRERELATRKHLPILAMTAHAMKGDRERCMEAGMDGYIAKPITPAVLTAEIKGFAQRRAPDPSPPTVPSSEGCIDWQAAWANLEGDRDLMRELANLFLEDLPQQMTAIRRTAGNGESRELERLAHRLKGSVGNFAAKPAFDAAFELEKVARAGDVQQIPSALDALEYEIRRLQTILKDWVHNPAGVDLEGESLPPPPSPAVPDSGTASSFV